MTTAVGFHIKYIKVHTPQMKRDLRLGLTSTDRGFILRNK